MDKYTDRLLDQLAEELMYAKGFSEETKKTSPLEWNFDEKDSQISMCREDVEAVLASFDKHRDPDTPNGGTTVSYFFSPPPPVVRKNKVQTEALVRLVLDNNPTISELREWLARVDLLDLDEATEIDGSLTLTITVKDTFIDKVVCGDCDAEGYVISECYHEV